MKRQLAFGIFTLALALASLSCRVSITATPSPTKQPSVTATITLTPPPTATQTPTPTSTPPLVAFNGPPLMELHMFNLTTGWGVTENQILITNDGAAHWAQVPLPNLTFNSSSISRSFIDAKTAYFLKPGAEKQPGQLLATRDGGATWLITETPFSTAELNFPNDNSGFAMQTLSIDNEQMKVAIYQTLDRGKTWTQVFIHTSEQNDKNLPAAGIKTGLSFIDASEGFIGLSAQENSVGLYHAEDAGRNWVKQELRLPDVAESNYRATVWPPFFFHQNGADGFLAVDFIASVSGASTRAFYSTNDAGLSWQKRGEIPEGSVFDFTDPQTGWVWGQHTLYSTIDGAKTWQSNPVAFSRSERANIIDFVDAKNGWLITADTKNVLRMYRSTDGGATWVAMAN